MVDSYEIKKNEEFREKIKNGELVLYAEDDSNWDYYIQDEIIYAIAKTDECCSTYFGSVKYYIIRKMLEI
ncbi:hypothetical protein [Clostridium estertheticum]|uniref:hypothetical protein n=1 Tax=Clostridium estertheticum TaxID=238834 RepID=UPI001C7D5728|nr:hypothetical protein [Clostridium estertheticum]MBX4267160.1 hypothetical protein [Clostridium estertheticum]MBX4272027.1 hypothetical protein [Clostridium estertheticum]WLC82412.1 hypothetical protein KTC98_24105 [Clostridium estertheticum]WLC91283.1 hypothetical protein KTC95_24065 [Clostridium estertheticum]